MEKKHCTRYGKVNSINGKKEKGKGNLHKNRITQDSVLGLGYYKKDTSEIVLDISSLEQGVKETVETTEPLEKKWSTSFWTQFKTLAWRNIKQSRWRIFDDSLLARAAIVAIAYCILYYQIPDTSETLRDRMGAVFFPLMFWGFAMVTDSVTSFVGEREVVVKERKAGAYRLSAYYIAKMVSELPMLIILPIVQLSVMYWLAGIGGPVKFAQYIGVNLLNCFTTQSIGYIVGACVPKFNYSIITANTIMVLFFLLGGFFNTHFPSWFAWAKYLSFLYYPFAAIVTLLFGDIEPFSCGSSQMFKMCQNQTEIVTGIDVLHSMGIDIPVYCSIGMMDGCVGCGITYHGLFCFKIQIVKLDTCIKPSTLIHKR